MKTNGARFNALLLKRANQKIERIYKFILLMADNVQTIRNTLNSVAYPITASYIAQCSGLGKSVVNSVLYANKTTQFEMLECIPPLWRVRPAVSTGVAADQDDS
jgi:hypothetical protein